MWSCGVGWLAKCIDKYVKDRDADEPVSMDPRLEGIVEKMFDRCIKDHQYKQVLNTLCIILTSKQLR